MKNELLNEVPNKSMKFEQNEKFVTNHIHGEEVGKEEEYIEGSEYIPLPSLGLFYNWSPQFSGLKKLRVRQLNYTDEDILTTPSFIENGTVFDELLKNVIVDSNNFPSTGLVNVDRETILLWLRSTSFGNNFSVNYNCPQCKHELKATWDLNTLKIPEYSPEVLEELEKYGEYSVKTPSGHVVKIAVPTIGKTAQYNKELEVKKKNKKVNHEFFGTGMLMLIVTGIEIDGKIERRKSAIESYFNKVNLRIMDSRFILNEFNDKINLSFDTSINIECSSCNHVSEGVTLPIGHKDFFWLSKSV